MKTVLTTGVLAVFAMSGAASEITFSSDTDASFLMDAYVNAGYAADASNLQLNNASGFAAASMSFGSLSSALDSDQNGNFDANIASSAGDFYLGLASGLGDNYFDAGQSARPSDSSIALAFGNSEYSANDVTITFNEDITAFGFAYEDVGDFGGTLSVAFSEGAPVLLDLGAFTADGFISVVSSVGTTIESITLTQEQAANDGFAFYGFSTVQVVPLPAPVLAGLGMLGGLGVARRLRQK